MFRGLQLSAWALGATAILLLLAVNLLPIGFQWFQQEQEYRAVDTQVEEAKKRNAELQAALDAWEDPDYIAGQAKSRLGFVWPGETQYAVTDLPQSDRARTVEARELENPKPWSMLVVESISEADATSELSSRSEVDSTSGTDSRLENGAVAKSVDGKSVSNGNSNQSDQ